MDQEIAPIRLAGALLLGAALIAGCGSASETLNLVWTGNVMETSPLHYEATGPDIFVKATQSASNSSEARATDAAIIAWHVVPENGGVFLREGEGMRFSARGPGTYEIWATAAVPVESPRVTLVVPPADQMRASPEEAVPGEAPIRLRIGPDGTKVGVEVGPVDVEVQTSNDPAPRNRGRNK